MAAFIGLILNLEAMDRNPAQKSQILANALIKNTTKFGDTTKNQNSKNSVSSNVPDTGVSYYGYGKNKFGLSRPLSSSIGGNSSNLSSIIDQQRRSKYSYANTQKYYIDSYLENNLNVDLIQKLQSFDGQDFVTEENKQDIFGSDYKLAKNRLYFHINVPLKKKKKLIKL